MSIYVEYYDSSYIDIAHRLPDFTIENEIDIIETHAVQFKGFSFTLQPLPGETFNIANDQHFRVRENTGGGDSFHFTGYVKNVVTNIKTGEINFDVVSELDYLKEQSVSGSLTGTTYRARLTEKLPTGYSVVEMDSEATDALDGNQPMTSWTYPGGSFADIIFDIMMIINAFEGSHNFRFDIMNKQIRVYGLPASATLTAANVEEIRSGSSAELVNYIESDEVNDNLRATGSITAPLTKPRSGNYYKTRHYIQTTEQHDINTNLVYNSVDYGEIVSISQSENKIMYYYETLEMNFVSS